MQEGSQMMKKFNAPLNVLGHCFTLMVNISTTN